MAGSSSQVSKQPFHETYELKEELGKYVFFEADWTFFFDVCLTFVCRIFLSEVLSASFAGVCIRRQKLSMPRKLSTPGNCRPEVRIEFSAVLDTEKLLLPYWTLSFKFKSWRLRIILVIFIFNWEKKKKIQLIYCERVVWKAADLHRLYESENRIFGGDGTTISMTLLFYKGNGILSADISSPFYTQGQ